VSGQLYALATLSSVPIRKNLGGPQKRSGRCGIEKSLVPTGNFIPVVLLVAIPTEISRFHGSGKELFQKFRKILCRIGT
jgi:hypothetical protein